MITFPIEVIETVEAAHKLDLPYESKCNRLHGHSYRIEVKLTTSKLNAQGMVIDFTEVRDIIRKYDHTYLNDFFEPTTAENFAFILYNEIYDLIINQPVRILEVSVWETPKNKATVKA